MTFMPDKDTTAYVKDFSSTLPVKDLPKMPGKKEATQAKTDKLRDQINNEEMKTAALNLNSVKTLTPKQSEENKAKKSDSDGTENISDQNEQTTYGGTEQHSYGDTGKGPTRKPKQGGSRKNEKHDSEQDQTYEKISSLTSTFFSSDDPDDEPIKKRSAEEAFNDKTGVLRLNKRPKI